MRQPAYLSPTSIKKYASDTEEFYLMYLADERPPRMQQTEPMSIGSAFDAYVKAHIMKKLHGTVDPRFERDAIFEQQVEKHNRDWAKVNGEHVFQLYLKSGALADLMIELENAAHDPRFEFTVEDRVAHKNRIDGIPFLGKPDVYWVTKEGAHVIYDWKVNGYCGKRPTSPKKGYVKCRDTWDTSIMKASRGAGGQHKDAQILRIKGLDINVAHYLEEVDKDWAAQLAIYGWVLGEDVGGNFLVGIDQLCGKPYEPMPYIRVASHRARIGEKFQNDLYELAAAIWDSIKTGYIFTDLSREENDEKCKKLDNYHKAYGGDGPHEDWFTQATRG